MDYKSIELLLLQLEESFSKSRSNIYSDGKKEKHFIELHRLFIGIKEGEYSNLKGADLEFHFYILNYIFKGLEYLDNSTLNIIPYEIVSCLERALSDWIRRDDFILVTSLSNRNLDFYFESTDSDEYFHNLNKYISKLYGLKITHRLIKISLPKVLSRDYLSCVVLYHELGHFVDNELNVSKKLLLANHGTDNPTISDVAYVYYNHTSEYFADLFAAQYINDASNLFLDCIASKNPDSPTHPATSKRITVVDNFLTGQYCQEKDEFNIVLKASGCDELKIRHSEISLNNSDFVDLVPQIIENDDQLHYIFKLGWDFWIGSETNFLQNFRPRQKYHIINNLMEKSISNYTITEMWNNKNNEIV